MIASLPMYWRDETADLWQQFWRQVQLQADLPDLTPPNELPTNWVDHWLDPNLTLSMTCSLPFRTSLRDKVTYVGTLSFGLPDKPGYYYSCQISSLNDTGQRRLAINGADSQSGWAVATLDASPYSQIIETGSHAASLAAVASGQADLAFIDAVTWRLLERYDPLAAQVRVSGRSQATPGLPLVTAKRNDPRDLQGAIHAACESFAPTDPMAMGGSLSLSLLDPADYLSLPIPPSPAGHAPMTTNAK